MARIRATLVAFALGLAACSPGTDPGPFTINYVLDTGGGGCASSECADFGLSCGAVVSIRITDPNSGEVIRTGTASGLQSASLCEQIAASPSLCDLDALPPGSIFFNLPPRMLRIEVAAWSAEALTSAGFDDLCPDENIFDLAGRPLSGFSPQPAFAGAVYFDAGSEQTEAVVPLACTDPVQLNTLECVAEKVDVRAELIDIEGPPSQTEPSSIPQSVLVRVAGLRDTLVDEVLFTEIDATVALPVLDRTGETSFSVKLDESEIPNPMCVVVLEQTPQATSTITCDTYPTGSVLDVRGTLLRRQNLEQILSAIDLDGFPTEGLVVGRVFNLDGVGVAGVSVMPVDAPDAVIDYLNSARDDALGIETFDNGYFIARGVPAGTEWTVSGAEGSVPVRTPVGGVVLDQLSLVPIQLIDIAQPRSAAAR